MYDIAMIGHFSKDVIKIGERVERRSGGAVFYGSIAAARAGAKVAAITRVAAADEHLLQPMSDNGIDVFAIRSDETTGIENRYHDATLERRTCIPLGFAGAYKKEELPAIDAKIWHVGGLIRGEADLELLKLLATKGKLSADAQGFVRYISGNELVYGDWAEKRDALPLIEYFKCDAAEAEILTGSTDVREAATILAGWGAKEIVLTHPGGLLLHVNGEFHNTPFTPREMLGRTGRGDTTISSYLAWRLNLPAVESARFAATLCSIKMEKEGPFSATLDDVLERMKAI